MSPVVIAIDGPAASGKSSVALGVAKLFGLRYVNSGAMYRALTWHLANACVNPEDSGAVGRYLEKSRIEAGFDGAISTLRINGRDPLPFLRSESVNVNVSRVSKIPEVRALLLVKLRSLAESSHGVVMEGRDIGTVVFPGTPYKFYLDASPEVRAARRDAEGQKDEIAIRDRIDSSRKSAPLAVARDAQVIDTSHMNLAEVIQEVARRMTCLGFKKSTAPEAAATR